MGLRERVRVPISIRALGLFIEVSMCVDIISSLLHTLEGLGILRVRVRV